MGLFSTMSKNPMASPMKPMAPPVKPDVSLGHKDDHSSSQPGHGGMLTSGELRIATNRLHRTGESGDTLADTLNQAADKHGGVLNARQFGEVIDGLERNHKDGIGKRHIAKLKDIAESSL